MYRYAVTHGGAAHRDEFLAIGLAIAHGALQVEAKVYRRNPTEEELTDPSVLVVDVGLKHDPVRACFDLPRAPARRRWGQSFRISRCASDGSTWTLIRLMRDMRAGGTSVNLRARRRLPRERNSA